MKKLVGMTCAAAMVFAPAAASAANEGSEAHKDAAKTCKELRKAAGKKAFAELYGKKGIGHCVKQETRENAAEEAKAEKVAKSNAAKDCKAEREADSAAFAEQYGTNAKGKNALGKCISQKAKANEEQEAAEAAAKDDAQVSAAKQCKAERKADPAAFNETYGTNGNKRNAFGKCVSKTTREMNEQEETEEPAEGTEA